MPISHKSSFNKVLNNICTGHFSECENALFILSVCDNIEDVLDNDIVDNRIFSKVMYLVDLIEEETHHSEKEIKKIIKEAAYYFYGRSFNNNHKILVISYLRESLKWIKIKAKNLMCPELEEYQHSLASDFKTVQYSIEPEIFSNSFDDCEFF